MSDLPNHKTPDGRPMAEQPKWRQDFPVDTTRGDHVGRREFAKFLVLTSGAMTAGHAYLIARSAVRQTDQPYPEQAIARAEQLAVGDVIRFEYPEPGDPCLLAKLDDDTLVAFGQKCTHLQCAVIPDLPNRQFVCPCHQGFFDAESGQPLAGPPRRPLPRILLAIRDGVIYATGVELST